MNNPIVLKTFAIISFIISGILTIMLMCSGVSGIMPTILTAFMGLCLEVAKCGFAYTAITNHQVNSIIRGIMGAVALCLIGSSILASAGFVTNQSNLAHNKAVVNSSQYKEQQETKALQKDLYAQKKAEIEDMRKLRDKQIEEGLQIKNNMPKNYLDRKQQQQAPVDAQATKMQEMINNKSNELNSLQGKIEANTEVVKYDITETNGYNSMFSIIATNLNKSDSYKTNPWTTDEVSFAFAIALSVLFELTAIIFAYLSQLNSNYTVSTVKKDIGGSSGIGFKPTFVTAKGVDTTSTLPDNDYIEKPYRPIGFYADAATPIQKNMCVENQDTTNFQGNKDINQDDLKIYLDYMYQTAKNNISTGYMSISKNTALTVEGCRKIKGFLERHGVIKTVGSKTIILKDNWSL